jgi:glycosyltransferase involved in cell wall biosynthesis
LPGVLESMVAGIPVVVTSGVRERLGADPACDLRAADDPVEFARHVAELLESDADRRQAGEACRVFAGTHWSWDVRGARLTGVLTEVVKRQVASPSGPDQTAPITAQLRG